jgi:hypothetical protein
MRRFTWSNHGDLFKILHWFVDYESLSMVSNRPHGLGMLRWTPFFSRLGSLDAIKIQMSTSSDKRMLYYYWLSMLMT